MIRSLTLLCIVFVFSLQAWAQSIHWEPPTGTIGFNQTSELQLVFENCEPKDDPAVPAVPGLMLQSVGQSSNMSIVNGSVTQTVVITFHARANQRDPLTIPTFSVQTNKGRIQVPAATYQVGEATVGQGNVALDAVANSKISVPPQVWAGEVFRLDYSLNIARRYYHSPGSAVPEWNPSPLAIEEWSKPEIAETMAGGESRIQISYRTRGYIKQPGDVALNSASQLVNLVTGTASFGFFSRPNLEQYAITSNRPNISVRALPAGAPAGFNGAVGQFKLDSKIVPTTSTVGEPITWTLTLSGTGNWPDINSLPSRDVSRDFRVVQPQARRTMKENSLFEGTLSEDVVLIPTQPGNYTLGPINWSFFNPAKGQYETVTTEKVSITVTAPAPQPTAVQPTTSNTAAPGGPAAPQAPAVPPRAPQPIPRDPLTGSGDAHTPWTLTVFAVALLVPVPLLLLFWVVLAWRRARRTDPFRPQREAQRRMRETTKALREAKDRTQIDLLLREWMRDAAILWQLPSAVPAVQDIRTRASATPETAATWATLWTEAERALYRAEGSLPSDWSNRAEAAVQTKPVPGFSPLQLFRGRNLLPFAAALILTAAALPRLHGEDGKAAYDRGDFGQAEAAWRTDIAQHSTNWVARHNLALALAQQNRWGEAAGYAVSAFVQHPRDPAVQWQLSLTGEHAGFAPGSLAGFLTPTPLHSIARLFSPADWQRFLVGCVCALVAGLALLFLQAYDHVRRWATWVGTFMIALAILGAIAGSVSLGLYSEASDSRAAIVWKPSMLRSIPTEADTQQKTSPLAAGTVAIIDKTFLGWTRLAFSNGQTGWVRQDDLVKLW